MVLSNCIVVLRRKGRRGLPLQWPSPCPSHPVTHPVTHPIRTGHTIPNFIFFKNTFRVVKWPETKRHTLSWNFLLVLRGLNFVLSLKIMCTVLWPFGLVWYGFWFSIGKWEPRWRLGFASTTKKINGQMNVVWRLVSNYGKSLHTDVERLIR